MLFLTIPTANSHPELLRGIIEKCGLPRDHIILVATRPDLKLPEGCVVIEDLGPPNIQRWWNLGIETAIQQGATAVAVLNDDLVIDNETLTRLHSELIRTGAAIATPTRLDWGAGLFKAENLFPYTPVIWGCLWMLDVTSSLRPDPNFVWWYGDSDLDIRARTQERGIAAVDVYFEHFYPGEGTSNSSVLMAQTTVDAETFERKYQDFLNISRSTPPRRLFVQGQQFAGRLHEQPQFRENFHRYVSAVADPSRDRVVLVEPSIEFHAPLRNLWAGWSNVLVISSIVSSHYETELNTKNITAYKISAQGKRASRLSNWKLDVLRFDPAAEIEELQWQAISLQDLISDVLPGTQLETLVVDLRVNSLKDAAAIEPSAKEIIAVEPTKSWKNTYAEARKLGLYFTGRPWGEARSSAAFCRKRSKLIRTWRTQAGELAASATAITRSLIQKASSWGRRPTPKTHGSGKSDPVNSQSVLPLIPFETGEIEAVLRKVSGPANRASSIKREWIVEIDDDAVVQQLVKECFQTHGVWPISMSTPTIFDLNPTPTEIISPIIPGYPYAFSDQDAYLARYADSYMAITHRKAGWDCFRHVEILASGSTPLMLDTKEIPKFSMVHYPKDTFKRVLDELKTHGGLPSWQFRIELREFLLKHLTTKSMANYLLSVIQAPEDARFIFIDQSLKSMPDYISALTAIGLKQIAGQRCVLSPEIDYLYADTEIDTNLLYGRGFGYSRKLEPSTRSSFERSDVGPRLNQFDYIVIGNVSRNWDVMNRVLENIAPQKVVLIHGEDLPPSQDEHQTLLDSGAHVFVRSIH